MLLLRRENLLQGAIVSDKGAWSVEGIEQSSPQPSDGFSEFSGQK